MEGPVRRIFYEKHLGGLELNAPTLDLPEAALGRAGESPLISHH